MDEKVKYFNFPITLLKGFLTDKREVLHNIFCYAMFVKTQSYEFGDDEVELMGSAESFFGVKSGDREAVYEHGQMLYDSIPQGMPKVGLNLTIYWDYHYNEKTEFEKVCLLAYLGFKSILGDKPLNLVTNFYWLARMDGRSKAIKSVNELSPELRKYSSRYQLNKIKSELELNWNIKAYGFQSRGFYISLKMPLADLIVQVEKKRKCRRLEQLTKDKKLARINALKRLNDDEF